MKKKRVNKNKDIMKKNNFVQGAFIATLGIVITKILGILYVIPFYAIIGVQGGAMKLDLFILCPKCISDRTRYFMSFVTIVYPYYV